MILPVALVLFAQAAPAQDDELVRAAKSPYDLARFVASHPDHDWRQFFKSLGVEAPVCGKQNPMASGCEAELISVVDPDQTILLLSGGSNFDAYLRYFGRPGGPWTYAGLQLAHLWNHPRRHELRRAGGVPFLLVWAQGIRGSGVDEEREIWYDLTQPRWKEVFSTLSSGWSGGFTAFERKETGFTTVNAGGITAFLSVRLEGGDVDLGSFDCTATYAGPSIHGPFSVRDASCGLQRIPPEDFLALEAIDPIGRAKVPTIEQLISFDFPYLEDIAKRGDSAAKRFLQSLLLGPRPASLPPIQPTPEVQKLRALLR